MNIASPAEYDFLKSMYRLFNISRVSNVDPYFPAVETRALELMARGMLSRETMLAALDIFLYFNRAGISRAIVRTLALQEKNPLTDNLKILLSGGGDDKYCTLRALYYLKHAEYDNKFRELKESARYSIEDLPLLNYTNILDAGCGTGLAGPILRKAGSSGHITGVDISIHMINEARSKHCYDELVVCGILEYLANKPQTLDAIFLFDVLPHFDLATLRQLTSLSYKSIRDNGALLLNAPFVMSDSGSLESRYGVNRVATAQVEQELREAGFVVTWIDEEASLVRQFTGRKFALPD